MSVTLHCKVGGDWRGLDERCGFCGAAIGAPCVEVEFDEPTPPPTTTEAEAAAREIADRWFAHNLPVEASVHSNPRLMLQALAESVISKHLPAAKETEDD